MPNVTVDQQKLVLNSFAAIFQNNLISKDMVTWKKYDSEMQDTNRLNVAEQVGPRYNVTRTLGGVADLTAGVQDSVFGSEQFSIGGTFGSSMGWGDFQKIRDIGAARESEALKNAAINLAETIDAYIMGFVVNAGNNWLGSGSAPVSDFDDVASAYTRLKEQGVDDADLRAVLSYGDKQALGSAIVSNNASLTEIGDGIYRQGFTGSVAGIPTAFTQQLPAVTVGSRVATGVSLTNGTTPVTYADVAISAAPGQYLTQTINIDGQSGAVTLREGEMFTIAGVYAYDNRAKKRLDHLQEFRVVGGVGSDGVNAGVYTAATGAFTNVRIFPAIINSGANQTVDYTGSLDNLAIIHKGAANAVLHPRAVLKKSAVVINTADLVLPATGIGSRKALTKVPLSVRMWQDSIFATGEHRIRFDVCLQANVTPNGRSEVVRINGS